MICRPIHLPFVLTVGLSIQSVFAASLPILKQDISPPKISALEVITILNNYAKRWHDGGRHFITSISYGSPNSLGYTPEHNWSSVTKLDEPSWFIIFADTKSTSTWTFRLFDSGKIECISQLAT